MPRKAVIFLAIFAVLLEVASSVQLKYSVVPSFIEADRQIQRSGPGTGISTPRWQNKRPAGAAGKPHPWRPHRWPSPKWYGSVDVDCSKMEKCFVEEDPLERVKGEAISEDDEKKFAKDTENRARHIMAMLDELNPRGMDPQEQKLHDQIAEDKRLIQLAGELRDKSIQVLMRRGIEIKLPSEDSTYVDASGQHWGNAESKMDLDNLRLKFHRWLKKEMDDADSDATRIDVKQFHNPLALPARTVDRLERRNQRDCPCTCPSTVCPCMCSAKVITGEVNVKVEADEVPEDTPPENCILYNNC